MQSLFVSVYLSYYWHAEVIVALRVKTLIEYAIYLLSNLSRHILPTGSTNKETFAECLPPVNLHSDSTPLSHCRSQHSNLWSAWIERFNSPSLLISCHDFWRRLCFPLILITLELSTKQRTHQLKLGREGDWLYTAGGNNRGSAVIPGGIITHNTPL